MNAKLFINYRREDTGHAAGRLYDRLIAHFGEDQVFIDIDQIEPGEDFVEVINRKVGACDIAIVAIGPNWLHVIDASGKRRLADEEDFVRMEIVAALQRKIRVIPVLVGGARMPGKHDLPEALAPISRRNAIELSETRFHADVNRLIEAIEKSLAVPDKKAESRPDPRTPATPPVPSTSATAGLKQPGVWTRKRRIIVSAIGATVILVLALTVILVLALPGFLSRADHGKAVEPERRKSLASSGESREQNRATAHWGPGKQNRVAIRPLKRTYLKVTVGDESSSPTLERWVSPDDGTVEFEGKHVSIRVLDPDAVQITKNGKALEEGDKDVTVN